MKKITYAKEIRYKGIPLKVNTCGGQLGCYSEILTAIASQLVYMYEKYSRIIVIVFDLHMAEGTANNEPISMLFRSIRKILQRTYGVKYYGYSWARELNPTADLMSKQHYHAALILDNHSIKHPSKLLKHIESFWTAEGRPKPYVGKNCYYHVPRGDIQKLSAAFYRMSYQAKCRDKGNKHATTNNYSTSRLKRNGGGNGD